MFALFIDMLDELIIVSLWPLTWNMVCTINCLNLATFSREFHRYVRWVYFCFSLTIGVKLWFVISAVLIYPHSLENSTAFDHAQRRCFCIHECLTKPTCEIRLRFWCIKVERLYSKWWRLSILQTQGAQYLITMDLVKL